MWLCNLFERFQAEEKENKLEAVYADVKAKWETNRKNVESEQKAALDSIVQDYVREGKFLCDLIVKAVDYDLIAQKGSWKMSFVDATKLSCTIGVRCGDYSFKTFELFYDDGLIAIEAQCQGNPSLRQRLVRELAPFKVRFDWESFTVSV